MSSTVAVEEDEILQVLRDYLEESGRVECLAVFERNTKTVPIGLPSELCWLRELVLGGSWEEVLYFLKALNNSGEQEGYKQCQFEAVKQQYLETIEMNAKTLPTADPKKQDNERMQELMHQLQELERLCPSTDSYKILCSLVTLPSLHASQEYSTWDMHTSRLQCFYTLGLWVSQLLYPDIEFEVPHSKSFGSRAAVSNRFLQLLSKGLLFEKCEVMCAQRCGEGDHVQQGAEILDLCSWIQHQPDSAFQVPPLKTQLVIVPHLGSVQHHHSRSSLEQVSRSVSIASDSSKEKHLPRQRLGSQSVPELQVVVESAHTSKAESKGEDSAAPLWQKRSLWHKPPKTPPSANSGHAHSQSEQLSAAETDHGASHVITAPVSDGQKQNISLEKKEENDVLPPLPAEVAQESKPGHRSEQDEVDGLKFKSNFSSDFTPNAKLHHKPRLGRDSSTPKPSGLRPATQQPFPLPSPVPYHTGSPQRTSSNRQTPAPSGSDQRDAGTTSGAKKCIDFDQSVQLPSAKLLCKVTDAQVVRSVAFSQSGELVAVGANSKTLRVCLTAPLLQCAPSNEDLPVHYHHPRYHKGSIYCMSWMGDSLLASGSNDQTIRLLSYNPDLPTPCKAQGQMNIHNGTVRDLLFTDNTGLLASGGAGDPVIKLTDCSTRQIVRDLSGHTDQILSLANVQEHVIASGSQDKTIKLWDLREKTSYSTIKLSDPVLSLTASGNSLASSHLDGSCTIHNLFSLKSVASYNAHSDECRTLRFSPKGGQWLLSGAYDGSVCICDTDSLEWQQVGLHGDKVVQCRWHCRGNVFASTGADKKACFWMLSDT